MEIKAMWPIFLSVLLAELGDKTQVAALTFAAGGAAGRWEIFLAASLALVLSTLVAVLAGDFISQFISPYVLKILAGVAFIIMGGYFIYQAVGAKAC
ncbi:MAG: TMEM165/GDT1 family protein [Deltaproteobacteria bacterium]|jgi:putative Ca2+/H+ antiporter (TMEM165/GDT1 family)|nr:TMEM165/GDT1 family protein [Deltaproteobacteria bacterium]